MSAIYPPPSQHETFAHLGPIELHKIPIAYLLFATLLYNIAIGLVWVYLFNVGTDAGIEEQEVANALTISQFLGIAGAFIAVLIQAKFGRVLPLLFGTILGALGIYWIVGDINTTQYWFGVCLFNFMWNMTMPYILATLAHFDRRSHVVAYGVSMQMIGYATGPFPRRHPVQPLWSGIWLR